MFNMKKTCVAFLSAAFGAVAVSGQTCAQVDEDGAATFPANTLTIADGAFYGCDKLKSVEIPNTVEIVEKFSFYFAKNLEKLTFAPGSMVQSLGQEAFEYCRNLKSVEIPASVEFVGDYTFFGAVNLTSVTFAPDSVVTKLGQFAFYNCESLKSVEIPASVEIVGDYTFASVNLASVTFAAGSVVTELGERAFSYTSIAKIILPDGLIDLGRNLFSASYPNPNPNPTSLRSIILPNSITSKGTGADYFQDTCVANLTAVDTFFSVETNPTNLIVCDCVQVANIFECPAVSCALCSLWLPSHKPTT